MDNQSNSDTKAKTEDMMGYEAAQAPETTLPETSNAEDVQTLINRTVKEVTVGEDGKYIYPDDIDPVLKAAVAATKSYRDNQSGFTKSQQSLKETEAERDALRDQLARSTVRPLELSKADQTELDKLYVVDPEAWRARMNKLDQQSHDAVQKELTTVTDEVRKKAGAEYELQNRYDYLAQFNEGRELPITPAMLDADIPPRITDKLSKGESTFEVFLDEVSEYLDNGKKVAGSTRTSTTDVNKGSNSSGGPTNEDAAVDYTATRF